MGLLADHQELQARVRARGPIGVQQGGDIKSQGGFDVHQELTQVVHTFSVGLEQLGEQLACRGSPRDQDFLLKGSERGGYSSGSTVPPREGGRKKGRHGEGLWQWPEGAGWRLHRDRTTTGGRQEGRRGERPRDCSKGQSPAQVPTCCPGHAAYIELTLLQVGTVQTLGGSGLRKLRKLHLLIEPNSIA